MAVITAQTISSLAIELLVRQLVLARTVSAVPGREFRGDNGDTISVRVRQSGRTAKVQVTPGSSIDLTPLDETKVDVQVAHLYDATRVSDEDLSLNLADFGSQVIQPLTATVATGAEDQLGEVMNNLPTDLTVDSDGSDIEETVLEARETLTRHDAPLGERFLAVSPEFASYLLSLENLSDASAAGNPSALREAVIGRLRGFTVIESNALDAGTAVAYHRSGFIWANRAPAIPPGAADASVSSQQGVALRVVRDFDATVLAEVCAVSTFAGAAAVYDDDTGTDNRRFVKLELSSST